MRFCHPSPAAALGLVAAIACWSWTVSAQSATALISDLPGNRVLKYEVANGNWTPQGDLIAPGTYGGIKFMEPVGMAIEGYNLFVATRDAVLCFDTDGNFQKVVARRYKDYAGVADSLTVDSQGNLYFSTPWGDKVQRIYKVTDPTGEPSVQALISGGLQTPRGLVIGHNGHLFVAERGGDSIKEFSTDGQPVSTFASGLEKPQALLWDAANSRYLVSYGPIGSQSIGELATNGTLTPLYKNPGEAKRSGFANTTTLQVIDGMVYGGNAEFKKLDRITAHNRCETVQPNLTAGAIVVVPPVKHP